MLWRPGLGLNGAVTDGVPGARRRPASSASSWPTATCRSPSTSRGSPGSAGSRSCPTATTTAPTSPASRPRSASASPTARLVPAPRRRRPPPRPLGAGRARALARLGRRRARRPLPPVARRRCSHRCQRARPAPPERHELGPLTRDLAGPGVGAGHRRPSRRRRVRLRRHAGQVGRRRLRRPPPRLHRRLEGHVGPDADTAALVALRQDEQRAAAKALGADRRRWCSSATSTASSTATWRSAARWPGHPPLRPDVVLGHDPWKRYRLHPDHRHAGLLVCDGIVAARDPHFFPEQGLAHHRPDGAAAVGGRRARPRRGRHDVRRRPSSPRSRRTPASSSRR